MEIARLTLESVNNDVYNIRARRSGEHIHYRIVDEYESELTWSPKASTEPLTMAQLVRMIDTADQGLDWPDFTDGLRDYQISFEEVLPPPEDLEELVYFVTVTSEFYPELQAYYEEKASDWYAEKASEWHQAQASDKEGD